MAKRILTTILGLPILYFVLTTGGLVLSISLLIMTMIGLHEFYSSVELGGYNPVKWAGYLPTVTLFGFFGLGTNIGVTMSLLPLFLLILMIYWVLSYKKIEFQDVLVTSFGFIYVALLFFTLMLIDHLEIKHAIWLVFVISWSCDSLAYLTGLAIGKHKLSPAISPKKTIEGAFGGIVGSMLGCFIFAYFVMPQYVTSITVLGFVGSVFSQTGDLSASLIKRKIGVKDFGRLFPGHGGVLDRFDSILFAAPVVYVYLSFWMMNV
mgnify:CR=1 FL=1